MPVSQIIYDYDKKQGNQQRGDGNGWGITYLINNFALVQIESIAVNLESSLNAKNIKTITGKLIRYYNYII